MRPGKLIFCLLIPCALGSCKVGGYRIFQDKVPPPIAKPPAQVESERQSAQLIADNIEKPEELKPVAKALSTSLGAPNKPLVVKTAADLPKVAATATTDLNAQLVAMQKQIADLNKLLAKNQGKAIEGTGFDLFGPGMATIIIGLIVLGVLCPPALTLMIFAWKRMKAVAGIVVNQVEEASKDPQMRAAVASIKEGVKSKMAAHPSKTTALQNVVTNLKTS